jgi:hypothetical protein
MFRIKPDAKKDDKEPKKSATPSKDEKSADKPKEDSKKSGDKPRFPPAKKADKPATPAPMGDGDEPDADDAAGQPDMAAPPALPDVSGPDASQGAPVHLYGKLSPMSAGYLGPENGPFACGNCRHFDGQGSCEIVDGPIDAAGCCSVFEPTDTPAGVQAPPLDASADMGAPTDVGQVAGPPSIPDIQA